MSEGMEAYKKLTYWMRERAPRMPVMTFPEGMTVQPVVPFGGATARFMLNGYSVYLDHYGELGCVSEPYWEAYDGEECHRFLLDEWEDMLAEISSWPLLIGEIK